MSTTTIVTLSGVPVTVSERVGRVYATEPLKASIVREFNIIGAFNSSGTSDEGVANQALGEAAGSTCLGGALVVANVQAAEEDASIGAFKGEVKFCLPDQFKKTGDTSITFSTKGGSQHITQSKTMTDVSHYPPTGSMGDGPAPEMNGVIGVTNTDIVGCEVNVPVFGFTATKYFAASEVTESFISALYELTGKTNDAPWSPTIDGITFSFDTGQVLFLGADGSRRGIGDVEISMAFVVGENRTDLICGGLGPITKAAWDYLWVRYEKQEAPDVSGNVIQYPLHAYVDRVYDSGPYESTGL